MGSEWAGCSGHGTPSRRTQNKAKKRSEKESVLQGLNWLVAQVTAHLPVRSKNRARKGQGKGKKKGKKREYLPIGGGSPDDGRERELGAIECELALCGQGLVDEDKLQGVSIRVLSW